MKAAIILETIGNTPHIRINRLFGDKAEVWIKSERANPGASIKDRIALSMIEDAERAGKLKPGGTIVEPTSGNTGIGLAMVAAVKGYKLILVMPDSMSVERRRLMLAYGATFDLTAARKGHEGRDRARRGDRRRRPPAAWMPQQFENPANLEVHRRTTAQEILADFRDAPLDALITGVGTGGHITACAEVLKKEWPGLKVFAVEPTLSPVLSGGAARPAPDPGHRRRLHPGDHGHRACSTASSRSIPTTPRKWPAARPARKACWSASRRARRSPRSRRSCRNWATIRASSASTTTPASAICRSRTSCPKKIS